MNINAKNAIINVAPYDTNTTEIESVDLALNGTNLTVSVNGKFKTADMSSLVPASMADRFLADATYDKKKKELVLVTRKEGEEDKEFRVPISHIFQVEVEELFTKEDGRHVRPRCRESWVKSKVPTGMCLSLIKQRWTTLKPNLTRKKRNVHLH